MKWLRHILYWINLNLAQNETTFIINKKYMLMMYFKYSFEQIRISVITLWSRDIAVLIIVIWRHRPTVCIHYEDNEILLIRWNKLPGITSCINMLRSVFKLLPFFCVVMIKIIRRKCKLYNVDWSIYFVNCRILLNIVESKYCFEGLSFSSYWLSSFPNVYFLPANLTCSLWTQRSWSHCTTLILPHRVAA